MKLITIFFSYKNHISFAYGILISVSVYGDSVSFCYQHKTVKWPFYAFEMKTFRFFFVNYCVNLSYIQSRKSVHNHHSNQKLLYKKIISRPLLFRNIIYLKKLFYTNMPYIHTLNIYHMFFIIKL